MEATDSEVRVVAATWNCRLAVSAVAGRLLNKPKGKKRDIQNQWTAVVVNCNDGVAGKHWIALGFDTPPYSDAPHLPDPKKVPGHKVKGESP